MAWTNVVIDWANALGIDENRIDSVEDLVSKGFLNKLISLLVPDNQKSGTTTCDGLDDVIQFIKDIYPKYTTKLLSQPEHDENGGDKVEEETEVESSKVADPGREDEIIILATLLLIHFSLGPQIIGSSTLRQRLDTLSHSTQCLIKNFLDAFLNCPPSLVTRSMIADSIQLVSFPAIGCGNDTPVKDFQGNITPSRKSIITGATELQKKEKEIKRLRLKLEIVLSEKNETEAEMKQTIDKLRRELIGKNRELKSLQEAHCDCKSGDESGRSGDDYSKKKTSHEEFLKQLEAMHRDKIDSLQMKLSVLQEETVKLRKQKYETANQLSIFKVNASEAESRVNCLEEENANLKNQLATLNENVEKLTLTCEKQAGIILEFDEKNRINYELNDSSISNMNTESLASEFTNLQTKQLEETLETKSRELAEQVVIVTQLNAVNESLSVRVNRLQTELFLTKEINRINTVRERECFENLQANMSLLLQKEIAGQKTNEELKSRLEFEISRRDERNKEVLIEIQELKNTLNNHARLRQVENESWEKRMYAKQEELEKLKLNLATAKDEFEKNLYKLKRLMKDKYNDHLSGVLESHRQEINSLKETALREKSVLEKELSELRSHRCHRSRSHDRSLAPLDFNELNISPMRGTRSVEQLSFSNSQFGNSKFEVVGAIQFKAPVTTTASTIGGLQGKIYHGLPSGPRTTSKAIRIDQRGPPSESPNASRLSVLQQRNTLCPPHLRSAYPLETQFLDPVKYQEQEIRNSAVFHH